MASYTHFVTRAGRQQVKEWAPFYFIFISLLINHLQLFEFRGIVHSGVERGTEFLNKKMILNYGQIYRDFKTRMVINSHLWPIRHPAI